MLSESRMAESLSSLRRLNQNLRVLSSQSWLITTGSPALSSHQSQDVGNDLSIPKIMTLPPADSPRLSEKPHLEPPSGLVRRTWPSQAAARSQLQPESETSTHVAELPPELSIARAAESSFLRQSSHIRDSLRSKPKTVWRSMRTCYVLIFLGFLTIIGSLIPALWRSINRNDVSGGFSIAQYVLGVGIFVVGCTAAIHSSTCTCWSSFQAGSEMSTSDHSEDSDVEPTSTSRSATTEVFELAV